MASAVATPLEKQFSTIAGIDSMTSTSALGNTQITIQFTSSRNIDAAAQDVQAAIAAAQRQMPPGMPTPPSYKKVNPADQPILFLALSSPTLPLYAVDEYAQTNLWPSASPRSRAWPRWESSARRSTRCGPSSIPSAMATLRHRHRRGAEGPRRLQREPAHRHAVGPEPGLQRPGHRPAHQRGGLPPADRGLPQRLAGAARGSSAASSTACRPTRSPAGSTTSARWCWRSRSSPAPTPSRWWTRSTASCPRSGPSCRPSVNLNTLYDRSVSIRDSVHDVQFTLLLAIALVVLVIFLFLRNVSATLIPSLALPMSIVGTFMVMYVLGYSLDNLSLMALTLAVGLHRGRRDRDAREHRAPHGEGQGPHRSGAGGLARDRLHHRFDDRSRSPRCSCPCCSWAASWAGCSTSSRWPSAPRSSSPASSR